MTDLNQTDEDYWNSEPNLEKATISIKGGTDTVIVTDNTPNFYTTEKAPGKIDSKMPEGEDSITLEFSKHDVRLTVYQGYITQVDEEYKDPIGLELTGELETDIERVQTFISNRGGDARAIKQLANYDTVRGVLDRIVKAQDKLTAKEA